MNKIISDITVVVVTFNRPLFLKRLINFYKTTGFKYDLLIADASDDKYKEINKNIYIDAEQYLNIDVHYLHGKNVIECVDEASRYIKTPYSIINPDDDFLIPGSLRKMSAFLERHSKYIAVNGSAILFEERAIENGRNEIITTGPYKLQEVIGSTAEKRLENLFSDYYGILFSLFRTNMFKEIFTKTSGKGIVAFELIPASRAALLGNIGHINELMLCRSANACRVKNEKPIKQIFESEWSEEIEHLKSDVINNLIKIDNSSYDEAIIIFQRIFSKYYMSQFTEVTKATVLSRFKMFFYNLSRRPLIRKWNNILYPWRNEFNCVRDSVEQNYEK